MSSCLPTGEVYFHLAFYGVTDIINLKSLKGLNNFKTTNLTNNLNIVHPVLSVYIIHCCKLDNNVIRVTLVLCLLYFNMPFSVCTVWYRFALESVTTNRR